ncbi:redoxin family protein [Nocardia salmonicida]|uniref:redoxin family protein n=1 Tax=Nocardia salmonicida TaxID=53431 RepID=UPI0037AB3E59
MRIGELARLAQLSPKAIRRYEALGLVAPERHPNGFREYDDHTVRLVQEIRSLNRLGIPVEETRPFLDCLATGSEHVDDCPASLAEYQRTIDALNTEIEALTARRDALSDRLRDASHRHSTTRMLPWPGAANVVRTPRLEPVDDGAAAHLPGLRVPSLRFDGTDGVPTDLAASTGRIVVYIYPLTGRPDADLPTGWATIPGARGCTAQACDFRDHHDDLLALGVHRVFGLSSQDSDYQREVVDRLGLPFTMLSDPELRLADELSIPTFTADDDELFQRITLVIRDAVIEHVFYPVFPPDRHAEQVLEWLCDHPTEPKES